ncbi:MAG: RNA-binding S4 domain-containing protein [Saccharofermentanales bacterium]|jgi:ribosomal 50S subunit-recycling heat shock protein|nr:RNA-binding S4 domain-containing protein [Clostridiaceae bacterium]
MRLDKFLKVSRVIKRRTVASEVCRAGRVSINGRPAKPGTTVKPGDILEIAFGSGRSRIRILSVKETVRKEEAAGLFEILAGDTGDQP